MDVDGLMLHDGLVALLGVLARGMEEKTGRYRLEGGERALGAASLGGVKGGALCAAWAGGGGRGRGFPHRFTTPSFNRTAWCDLPPLSSLPPSSPPHLAHPHI